MLKIEYLTFEAEVVDDKCQYKIWNDKQENLGKIVKVRVGRWLYWCLFLNPDCYMSAGCIDEVREKIRQLNSNKLKKIRTGDKNG